MISNLLNVRLEVDLVIKELWFQDQILDTLFFFENQILDRTFFLKPRQ